MPIEKEEQRFPCVRWRHTFGSTVEKKLHRILWKTELHKSQKGTKSTWCIPNKEKSISNLYYLCAKFWLLAEQKEKEEIIYLTKKDIFLKPWCKK